MKFLEDLTFPHPLNAGYGRYKESTYCTWSGPYFYLVSVQRLVWSIHLKMSHSPELGQFVTSAIRLGSRGDSYYEYLLKQYLQTVWLSTSPPQIVNNDHSHEKNPSTAK